MCENLFLFISDWIIFSGVVAILKFTKTCLQIIHTSNICVWFGLNVWNDIQEECVCLYFP
jgi:hypothetical protein